MISVIITLLLLLIWYLTLITFHLPIISILILWMGMILLSITYFFNYKKKKRDMTVFKYRFLISALPIYPTLAFYVYRLMNGKSMQDQFLYLPVLVIFTMLTLNAIVVYSFDKRKQEKQKK